MKLLTGLPLLLAGLAALPASALEIVPFDADRFARAQSEGRVSVVQFHSGWCPTCVMQERGVKSLKDDKALDRVTVFQADYFKEEALRKRFNCEVDVSTAVDASLIGGAVIDAGSVVIDGSLKGKLARLQSALTH